MSHAHHHDPTVPREAVIGAGVLLAFVLALTAAVSWGFIPQSANPGASRAAANIAPALQRDLHFADGDGGSVVVSDADSGETIKVIGYGEEGFTRATLRRLAKVRAAQGVGSEPAFRLIQWENGALSLHDPATGEEAEIHGYGPDHSAAFAALLEGEGA